MKRRNFLKRTIGVGTLTAASTLSAPAISKGKIQWKMVTCWPKNFPALGTGVKRIADSIYAMSDGRLEIKIYGAGELVPPFEVFDAVREGIAEMGHDAPYYWTAKHSAMPFFTCVPGGLTAQEHAAWIYFGGGQELWDELYNGFGLKAFLAGTGGCNVGGWFKKEINSLDDLKGLRMRIPGLGGDMLSRIGAIPVNLPGGELLPALQSGAIDAVEWIAPYNDLAFGFHKIAKYYYAPGIQEPGSALGLTVNLEAYNNLPNDLQNIIKYAAGDEAFRMLSEMTAGNAFSLDVLLNKHKVKIKSFPKDVTDAMFKAASEILLEKSKENEFTKRVYDSWSSYWSKATKLSNLTELGYMNLRANYKKKTEI